MNWPQPKRAPDVAALAVRVPGRREHRRAVVVEEVDLVVVVGDDDLALRVVVELPDPDVLPVGPVAVVADAVEARVGRAVPRPAGRVRAGGGEDEDLRAGGRRVGGRGHDLDATVSVEVGRRHAAGLRALAAAAGRGGPAGLGLQPAGAEVVGRHGSVVAADDDLLHAVAVEVGDHAGRVDPPFARRALAQEPALRVVDERAVEGRDDLELLVAGEIDEPGRREPTRLPRGDVAHEARLRHRRARGVGRRQATSRTSATHRHMAPTLRASTLSKVVPAHSAAQRARR